MVFVLHPAGPAGFSVQMKYAYRLINVFTAGGAFTGNPLCVFENSEGLTTETMQALARQFNLSETTFIADSKSATASVRIFTPAYEMPFAGHPTLGTAFVVDDLKKTQGDVTLEMQAGIIPVKLMEGFTQRWQFKANRPKWRAFEGALSELAGALSLGVKDLAAPVLWVDSGNDQLMLPVSVADAVDRAAPQADKLGAFGAQFKVLVFHRGADFIRGRFFFRQGAGFSEDPATGSACANLGGWHLSEKIPLPVSRIVVQGDRIGRPSMLYLDIATNEDIFVAGDVTEIGRGSVEF